MKNDKTYFQQGDVTFSHTISDEMMKHFKGKNVKGSTLELGEVTGHHHTIYADEAGTIPAKVNLKVGKFNINGKQIEAKIFEVVNNVVYLRHQEHNRIDIKKIEKGNYVQTRTKTWDYTEKVAKPNQD